MHPALQVRGLGKKYRLTPETAAYRTLGEAVTRTVARIAGGHPRIPEEFWALRDVSFDVDAGEVIGIIGRNGAGKSTLLKILSRITAPTTGEARLWGHVASLLEVGTGFHPELSGRENIYLSGSILGMKRREIDARFDEIVRFAGMERFLDTPAKRYSSGMYVRLAFAVAAHLEPEILVIDEVLAVGDAEFQQKCIGKMGDVAGEGRTVLFVSHNLAAVSSLCTTGLLLDGGRVAARGSVSEVVAAYSALWRGGPDASPVTVYPERTDSPASVERIAVTDARGRTTLVHAATEPVTVTVAYSVSEHLPRLDLWFMVFGPDGTMILQSCDKDAGGAAVPVAPGRYTATVTLPAPLLNAGQYELQVSLQTGHTAYDIRRGIVVTLEDRSGIASAVLGCRRDGTLCIPLAWEAV
jgi:lipopolysaccharide transport system ATP-binding protein